MMRQSFIEFDLRPQVVSPAQPADEDRSAAGISFRNVSFKYPENERFARHNFNLNIAPGQTVAIVGHDGAGKSTLPKLLCRFYDPEGGEIYIGDTRLCDLAIDDVRASISVLFQEPVQFNASATDNIAYGAWSRATALAPYRSRGGLRRSRCSHYLPSGRL
jgi:ATP-binding cassette, subfamily B, bacterial